MIELAVIVVAGCVIIGIVAEVFQRIEHDDAERYDDEQAKSRLLDEVRRQP